MNDIIKTITPSPETVTNLSNDNVSLYKRKLNHLKKKLKVSKMKISTLRMTSRPNSELLKTYPGLKIDTVKISLPIKKS